jgi:hypothetical protein
MSWSTVTLDQDFVVYVLLNIHLSTQNLSELQFLTIFFLRNLTYQRFQQKIKISTEFLSEVIDRRINRTNKTFLTL